MHKLSEDSLHTLRKVIYILEQTGITTRALAENTGLNAAVLQNKLSTFKRIEKSEEPLNRNYFSDDDVEKMEKWVNQVMNYFLNFKK